MSRQTTGIKYFKGDHEVAQRRWDMHLCRRMRRASRLMPATPGKINGIYHTQQGIEL